MHNELYPRTERKNEQLKSLALVGSVLCGMSAGFSDAYAQTDRAKEEVLRMLDASKPLTAEQQREVAELRESSPFAQAIKAVPESTIRAEGYQGDISKLKEQARSQIYLLYGVYDKIPPDKTSPLINQYPLINIELFTKGMYIYFDAPPKERLATTGFTRRQLDETIDRIKWNASSLLELTDLPVTRVSKKEDATMVVFLNDQYQPHPYFDTDKREFVQRHSAMAHINDTATASFFPVGTVSLVESSGTQAGIELPFYQRQEKGGYFKDFPKLNLYYAQEWAIQASAHETGHWLGFEHELRNRDHLMYYRGDIAMSPYVRWSGPKGWKEQAVLPGDKVHTDPDSGEKFLFRPSYGDIKKSPVRALIFFLRLFAKQNADQKRKGSE